MEINFNNRKQMSGLRRGADGDWDLEISFLINMLLLFPPRSTTA